MDVGVGNASILETSGRSENCLWSNNGAIAEGIEILVVV
jgi:hypothetical protein